MPVEYAILRGLIERHRLLLPVVPSLIISSSNQRFTPRRRHASYPVLWWRSAVHFPALLGLKYWVTGHPHVDALICPCGLPGKKVNSPRATYRSKQNNELILPFFKHIGALSNSKFPLWSNPDKKKLYKNCESTRSTDTAHLRFFPSFFFQLSGDIRGTLHPQKFSHMYQKKQVLIMTFRSWALVILETHLAF